MREILDRILLSGDVVNEFYDNYNNPDFKGWLLAVLPEIEDCGNLKQDNPWHIYNCLDHILHSVQNMNEQTLGMENENRRMLAYVMFMHDIGKPACHIRRYSKLYQREVDSFFNHNLKSKEIAQRVLDEFGFGEEQQKIMELLINEHDIFMFITLENDGNPHHRVLTESLIDEKVQEYNNVGDGKEILKYLIKVGRADNLAQNPKMTPDSLLMLDKFQFMLTNQCESE